MEYLCLVYAEGTAVIPPDADDRSAGDEVCGPAYPSRPARARRVERATTVRVRNGHVAVTAAMPRPGTELTAFFVLRARDLNDAIRIAATEPVVRSGRIEVRPLPDRGTIGPTEVAGPADHPNSREACP